MFETHGRIFSFATEPNSVYNMPFTSNNWTYPGPARLSLMIRQEYLRRHVLRALIVIALCGICACGQVDNSERLNARRRQAGLAYRKKLLAKVKSGWDGNIAASKKSGQIKNRGRR